MIHENHDHTHAHEHILEHHTTVWGELLCHVPYAIFSVAFAMICLSILAFLKGDSVTSNDTHHLFHNFHFLHLLFAATGTMLTFRRFSKNIGSALIVSFIVPIVFCTTSDALLPYLGGRLIGLPMDLHWCFIDHLDIVLPFLIGGMINGLAMSTHKQNLHISYSLTFHFFHIFVSSMASILYLVSFGFHDWAHHMGFVFIFLVCAVLLPCTASDIIVPMLFAKSEHKNSK